MTLPSPAIDAAQRVERIGDATLLLGDCLAILPHLGPVDAVVTDPPYGMSRQVSGHKVIARLGAVTGDDEPFDPRPFLIGTEHIFWGANHFASRLPDSPTWLVWQKHDQIMFGRRSTSPFELAWTDLDGKAIKAFRLIWDGSIKQGEGHGQPHVHPTQKPVEVMTWSVDQIAGQTVLDPFMGSGTTGIACARLGRRFVGIETERQWFDLACERIDQALTQPDIFAGAPA